LEIGYKCELINVPRPIHSSTTASQILAMISTGTSSSAEITQSGKRDKKTVGRCSSPVPFWCCLMYKERQLTGKEFKVIQSTWQAPQPPLCEISCPLVGSGSSSSTIAFRGDAAGGGRKNHGVFGDKDLGVG